LLRIMNADWKKIDMRRRSPDNRCLGGRINAIDRPFLVSMFSCKGVQR
jgi:hypothetical protein